MDELPVKYLWAADGQQALDYCTNDLTLDLVLLDIKLPKLSGYEVIKRVKEVRDNLPIIAQTAFALKDDIIKMQEAGFDYILTKPIKRNDLIMAMHKSLTNS